MIPLIETINDILMGWFVLSCFLCEMLETTNIESIDHQVKLGSAAEILHEYFQANPNKRPIVIADDNTLEHCWPSLVGIPALSEAEIIQIPHGEQNKTIEVCNQIWLTLSELKLSRNDVVVNLGGGVITDLGGFVAATFKRGVSFIQVPTSLLAMVDASVGGKVGVDLEGLKNLVGSFAIPDLVVVDVDFLDTLPSRQLLCGFAEVLKHGLILDQAYWKKSTLADIDSSSMKGLVHRSVELKNSVVVNDFKESGERKKLNFGHTIGHALETHFLETEKALLHGEAVAVGMIAESWLSKQAGVLSEDDYQEIEAALLKYYTIPEIPVSDFDALIEHMYNDKKNIGGKINCTYLTSVGESVVNNEVNEPKIREVLGYLSTLV